MSKGSWRRVRASGHHIRLQIHNPNRAARLAARRRLTEFCAIPDDGHGVSFTEARNHLTELLDEVERLREHVVITRNGRPAAVVLSQDEYDSLLETLEILADDQALADLEGSERDVAAGETTGWIEVKQQLSLG